MKFLIVSLILSATALTHAQVAVYTGDSGEKLILQQTPDLGKEAALVKFEGVPQSKWQNRVIKVNKVHAASGTRYEFNYDLVLSDGKHPRTYGLLIESGSKLIKGTQAKRMEIYVQGSKNPVEVFHDLELTKSSQKTDLKAEYKKKPYVPDVE